MADESGSKSDGMGVTVGRPYSTRGVSIRNGIDDELMIGVGHKLLAALSGESGGTGQLWDLIDRLGSPIEEVLAVLRYLEERGFIKVTRRDLRGNHTLEITAIGSRAVS